MKNNRIFILNNPYAPRLNPELAQEIGLNKSLILLQLEYWISLSNHVYDGRIWTYQSATSIKKLFKFYSESTINRTLKELLDMGLIIASKHNKKKYDQTRWFALNYENLARLESIKIEGFDYNSLEVNSSNTLETDTNQIDSSTSQNEQSTSQNDSCQTQNDLRETQIDSTIPKTTTKNKDIKDSQGSNPDSKSSVKIFDDKVYKITDKIIEKISANHPRASLPKNKSSSFYIKWASEIDRLHRLGPPNGSSGYSYQEISDIAKWTLNDAFWSINIQSTAKFRAKIITLDAQYKASVNKSGCVANKTIQSNSKNKFHNFEKSKTKYTNAELEKILGVRN